MNLSLLDKFPHWSEVLAVLTYAESGDDIPFVSHKWLKDEECYVDPLGKRHTRTITSKYAADEERALVVNGSIHLETHPLNKGKIPYTRQPYKIAIEHTTGYSPWDFLQMVDLAGISADDPEKAQGSHVIYLMNKKCHDRFLSTDWSLYNKSYYEVYKDKINDLVSRGYIIPTSIEPAQFWLENVKSSADLEQSDNICLCLNWCNLNKVDKVNKIVEICNLLHNYTGKEIDIRLHSYSREGLFHYLSCLPYVHLIPYLSMSKYDIMDKYRTYFVDGTGLGYEIAYRNRYNNRDINIFYLSGLNSDEPYQGFDGISQMKACPKYDYKDFLSGVNSSNFSSVVISESFPHTSGNVPNECYNLVSKASEKF